MSKRAVDYTMMVPMTNGLEFDVFYYYRRANWSAGTRKLVKARYNRRNRKSAKMSLMVADTFTTDIHAYDPIHPLVTIVRQFLR